jgi:hypothetical protein
MTAKHLKTTAITTAGSGTCEPGQEKLETDGWYVDVPYPEAASADTQPVTCKDEVHVETSGPKPGYPVAYVSTATRGKADPNTMSMNVTELSTDTLPSSFFDPPADYVERKNAGALMAARPKLDGVVRVGVVPINDASGHQLDLAPFHTRLAGLLTGNALQGVPLGAPTEADAAHCDFILQTDVATITKSAVGQVTGHVVRVGSLLSRAGRGGGAGGGAPAQDGTAATLNFRLMRIGTSEEALASSAAGRNGSALNIRTAIQIAMMVSPMGMMMHSLGGQGFMTLASHFMSGSGVSAGGGDPALNILFSLLQQPSSAGAASPEMAAVSAALENEAQAVKTKLQSH